MWPLYIYQFVILRWFQNWFQIYPATNGSHASAIFQTYIYLILFEIWYCLESIVKKMEFWNSAKNPIFNFFQIFFFLNHYWYLYFRFKKSDWQHIISFYLILYKKQKPPNLRGNANIPQKTVFFRNFEHKFGISDQKRFGIDLQTCWIKPSMLFCCTV